MALVSTIQGPLNKYGIKGRKVLLAKLAHRECLLFCGRVMSWEYCSVVIERALVVVPDVSSGLNTMDNHVICNNAVLDGAIYHTDHNEVVHGDVFLKSFSEAAEKWAEALVLLECSAIESKEPSRTGEDCMRTRL